MVLEASREAHRHSPDLLQVPVQLPEWLPTTSSDDPWLVAWTTRTPLLMEHLFSKEGWPINSACAGSQPALLLDASDHRPPHKVTSPRSLCCTSEGGQGLQSQHNTQNFYSICPWATHTKMLAEISLWSTSPVPADVATDDTEQIGTHFP